MLVSKIIAAMVRLLPDSCGRLARKVFPNSAKRMLGRQAMRTMEDRKDPITARDGRQFHPITDRVFLNVAFSGDYEPDLTQVVRQVTNHGDICVDVGANFGWYSTLLGKQVGDHGKVYSFEPSARVAEILRNNLELNTLSVCVEVTEAAVGPEAGQLSLVSGGSSDSGNAHVAAEGEQGDTVVNVVSLDQTLQAHSGNIAFIKIDVEGFEQGVLTGASQLLSASPAPIIQIEVNGEALQRAGSSREKILEMLSGHGYEFFSTATDGSLTHCRDGSHSDLFCATTGEFGDRLRALVGLSSVTSN